MPVLIMMNKPYNDGEALETVVHYVLRTGSGYCGGYGVDLNYPVQQMQQVKNLWGKDHGRRVRHFILSFKRSESIGYDQAMKLGFEICRYYADYQSVYGLHHDSHNYQSPNTRSRRGRPNNTTNRASPIATSIFIKRLFFSSSERNSIMGAPNS